MPGDGDSRGRVVGDYDDLCPACIQRGHAIELLRRDTDGIEDVSDAVAGKIFRLGQR